MKNYFRPKAALDKLKKARATYSTAYIYGATGYGKTLLVDRKIGRGKRFYFSCTDTQWDFAELEKTAKEAKERGNMYMPTVIFDDLHLISEERREIITKICDRTDIWTVLISRSNVPGWLRMTYYNNNFVIISEEDLSVTVSMLCEYAQSLELELDMGDANRIVFEGQGNPLAIKALIADMMNGAPLDDRLIAKIYDFFIFSLKNKVLVILSDELKDFLIKMSIVDSFTEKLAEAVTGKSNVAQLITKVQESGNFLVTVGDSYVIRSPMLFALRNEIKETLTKNEIIDLYQKIAIYHEIDGDEMKAFEFYTRADNKVKIKDMLIKNSMQAVDNAYFFEMKKYYMMLTEEDIEERYCLMEAMSILYSLMMNVEKSEYWYRRLKAKEMTASDKDKKEILARIAYLDIALPHRGSVKMVDLLKSYYTILKEKSITFPDFSLTSNLPSTMNGGKDFCEWSKRDKELAMTIGKLVTAFLKSYGNGLVSLALAESFLEKNGDPYEITNLIQKGKTEIESADRINFKMLFVAVGLQIRKYLEQGEIEEAKPVIRSFIDRIDSEKDRKLMVNATALCARIALYEGDKTYIDEWMRGWAPDETDFCILDRYRYMTKLRCYIATERYAPAIDLIGRMKFYAENYDRKMIAMELGLLTAIIKYRQRVQWREEFIETLKTISEYKFVNTIADEGTAILPLLDEVKEEMESDRKYAKWFREVYTKTNDIAIFYPVYLKPQIPEIKNIPEHYLAIIRAMAEGLSREETGRKIGMTARNVKFHAENFYKMLGVNNKTDAILVCKNMKLL